MTDDNKPVLRRADVKAIQTAVGYAGAGPIDGWSSFQHAALESVGDKLAAAPVNATWLPFSRKELELLWHALGNGAGDDAIMNLGLRADERATLANACNRIADAGRLGGPRF